MSSSAAVASAHDPALDLLPSELQDTIMEKKFAQIREQRREAHHVLREAKQRTRNQQTDQQILMLMQTDERLASLLSQAADSMRALLPVKPPSPDTVRLAPSDSTSDAPASSSSTSEPTHGARAFESKAQQWFSILNEVQYSLRSAVRYLRDSNLAPLTPPAGAEARLSGNAGSAARAHNLSLLDAFVDLAGIDGPTFKLPPAAPASTSSGSASPLSEPVLSVHALRERDRNWKALSSSLQHMHDQSKLAAAQSPAHTAARASPSVELSLLDSIRNGCSSDRILIDALVNTNSMA
ncbi:uncharacterized protein PSANT_06686 [Moesziomyces antarcticus]|nr:uncharacterized protein PSANT_06686 [Moesziomyces antarcticus]